MLASIIAGVVVLVLKKKEESVFEPLLPTTNVIEKSTKHNITFKYEERIGDSINDLIEILDDLIISVPQNINIINTYDINLGSFSDGIIGTFRRSGNKGIVNIVNTTSTRRLNNKVYNLKTVILLHEIMHGFGIGTINGWNGSNTRINYNLIVNSILGTTDYDKDTPIEDDGGSGTANAHYEEDVIGINDQRRQNDSSVYYTIGSELMSGYLDIPNNYLTLMTVGSLTDLGYQIDTNSQYIYKDYTNKSLLDPTPS